MDADSLKLTSYFGERHRSGRALVADELLGLYGRRAVHVSLLLRGVEGFGSHHRMRTDRLLTLSEDLPVVSVAVDRAPVISGLLGDVLAVKRHGLVTLERARLLTGPLEEVAVPDSATKLTVYLGRQERAGAVPAYLAVCERLYRRGIAGATVLLGVDGTLAGERRRARLFARNADVPLMIVAVGDGARIAAVLPELAALLRRPLVTLERVDVLKRDGARLGAPRAIAAADSSGLPLWQKLMVYTSEQAKHAGLPLHVALVRALREGGARGATCLRGLWGFHGDHPPHGDRLLALRRRVPVVTIVIDTPAQIARWFEIVDAMTREAGLVTAEVVPAAIDVAGGAGLDAVRLAQP